MKNKKRSSKNLKINTRIVLTTVVAILIPVIIIASFSTVFIKTISSYFNFSSVTTNSYSVINQIQWSQTLWSITTELANDDKTQEQKLAEIEGIAASFEKTGSRLYIEKNNQVYFATDNNVDIPDIAQTITNVDKSRSINYFGENGLVIVNNTKANGDSFMVMIVNEDYTVNTGTQKLSIKDLTNLILSRTGLLIMFTVFLFAIAIAVISFITSKTIVKPVKKIAEGADEIARGNLDYTIDYESTNELGQTVNSFNDMRLRLKESIDKERAASEERRVLVAGIAHDLRTPLTSAKGYAEGLLDGIADTPEKKEKYIRTICQSINNTEQILDDLLTVSKLELKGYELNLVDVSAIEFFSDGVEDIKSILEDAQFDFEHHCNCGENAVISIDPDRFARVVGNIISNSIKYAREGVKGKIVLSINEYERSVIIEIRDNGIGVDRESLPKIFDTMYRADPARTRVADGSGLGLSVCRQIVTLHGGSIWATSRVNDGLSIFISLPKKEASADEQSSDN